MDQRIHPDLGFGLGLRSQHYSYILESLPKVDWFEAITENFLGISGYGGGRPVQMLEKIRQHYPIVLHGVSMSIGSTDPLNTQYLSLVKELINRVEPQWVSDHLCWTGVNGKSVHDLLPLPYTEEVIQHLSDRILAVQEFLGRRIAFENVSGYLRFTHSEMTEWEFLSEVSRRADCLLLLDINNIYVNSINQGFSAEEFLNGIPRDKVVQFHIAGHSNNRSYLIDTHDQPVCEDVWALLDHAYNRFGSVSTLLERDENIPEFTELEKELLMARKIRDKSVKDVYAQPKTL